MMKNNVCKFNIPSPQDRLSVACFVLEKDQDVMREKDLLDMHCMYLVAKGEGVLRFDSDSVHFSAGDLIFGFKGEIVSTEPSPDCEYMYIRFDGVRAEEFFRRFGVEKSNRRFSNYDGMLPLWKESLMRADRETLDLVSESILLYSFSKLSSETVHRNNPFNQMVRYIDSNFTNPELSVALLAKEFSYNEKYISHVFKSQMGIGISEYIRTIRIKYVVSLFDHGLDSIKNVSLLAGFSDPLYFSTVFKKVVGISPKEYIKTLQEKNV